MSEMTNTCGKLNVLIPFWQGGGRVVINTNMRVLVVDDFSTMRRIIKNILKQLSFNNIVEADDGAAAWEILNKDQVDFIVSDWNMPPDRLFPRLRTDDG